MKRKRKRKLKREMKRNKFLSLLSEMAGPFGRFCRPLLNAVKNNVPKATYAENVKASQDALDNERSLCHDASYEVSNTNLQILLQQTSENNVRMHHPMK
ncbi:hypothetical protein L3X38_022395 [Prunus dulcis]|uniref:Uncharacterized protein n=1 Tax=Prunus dulcis TaxID=3755 RepID=A0AAD4VYE2_PRUDU|nr:hypothetical protein L3X38_022395 [Prunus dulcis]